MTRLSFRCENTSGTRPDKKNIDYRVDGPIRLCHHSLPSIQAMKTNRTHLNSTALLIAREGEILCVGLGFGFMPSYVAQKDWSLPTKRYDEQGALKPH